MALTPSKRSRLATGDGQGNSNSSTTIPIGIFVTKDSFDEIRTLMLDSTDFYSFYSAVVARQTSSSTESKQGGMGKESLPIAPVLRNFADCCASFTDAKYSSKLFADLEEGYQELTNVFAVPWAVQFWTMNGEWIHTISLNTGWDSMRKIRVEDILFMFMHWVDEELRYLTMKRDAYLEQDPNVERLMPLETYFGAGIKPCPVLFEEITQRHVSQYGLEQGHCKKPCAKRDYVFRIVMDYSTSIEPSLRYAGHFHRGNRVHPRPEPDDEFHRPTFNLNGLPNPQQDEDDDYGTPACVNSSLNGLSSENRSEYLKLVVERLNRLKNI